MSAQQSGATDLKQLAALLGLSITTVSRSLSGYPDVSPATRARVSRLAEELGYRANLPARRLARGKVDAVGMVGPLTSGDLRDHRFLEFADGLSAALGAERFDLILISSTEQSELETYRRVLGAGNVDGLVIAHPRRQDPRLELLQHSVLPFVAFGRTDDCDDYSWFDFDHRTAGLIGARQALARGHRRIVYLHESLSLTASAQRHAGHQAALAEVGPGELPNLTMEAGRCSRDGYAAAMSLLTLDPAEWPTAIICDNPLCGQGVLSALMDRGVPVGEKVSVVIHQGLPPDHPLPDMKVASVDLPTFREAGLLVAKMLIARMDRPHLPPQQVLRDPVFRHGDTLGVAPRSQSSGVRV